MKTYTDNFGNKATIEEKMILPYKDSPIKEKAFILSCYSTYENDFMYYRCVFEDMKSAKNRLSEFSCNTWKEV